MNFCRDVPPHSRLDVQGTPKIFTFLLIFSTMSKTTDFLVSLEIHCKITTTFSYKKTKNHQTLKKSIKMHFFENFLSHWQLLAVWYSNFANFFQYLMFHLSMSITHGVPENARGVLGCLTNDIRVLSFYVHFPRGPRRRLRHGVLDECYSGITSSPFTSLPI
jgi:hypothetical protein